MGDLWKLWHDLAIGVITVGVLALIAAVRLDASAPFSVMAIGAVGSALVVIGAGLLVAKALMTAP